MKRALTVCQATLLLSTAWAGVTPGPVSAQVVRCCVTSVPLAVLGPGPYSAFLLDGHGHLYAADVREMRLGVFRDDGGLSGSTGRRGQGPGEFQAISAAGILEDGVWIYDAVQRRVSMFGSRLQLRGILRLPERIRVGGRTIASSILRFHGFRADTTFLVEAQLRERLDPIEANGRPAEPGRHVMVLGADGELVRVVANTPENECTVRGQSGATRIEMPFCATGFVRTSPDGEIVAIVQPPVTSDNRVRVTLEIVGPGRIVRRATLEYPAKSVTTEDIQDDVMRHYAAVASDFPVRVLQEQMELPKVRPPIRDVRVGRDGRVALVLGAEYAKNEDVVVVGEGGEWHWRLPTGSLLRDHVGGRVLLIRRTDDGEMLMLLGRTG